MASGQRVFRLKNPLIKLLLYGIGLTPAIWMFYRGATGHLGADPVRTFEDFLGLWAFRFLLATLLVTPLRVAFNINLIAYRRMLGVLTFAYALMHVSAYLILDLHFDFSIFVQDVTKRPFLIFGMATFLCLLPLGLTSNNISIRKLGRRWQYLHRLAYLALITASVHFLMAFKTWHADALLFVAFGVFLLLFRLLRARPRQHH